MFAHEKFNMMEEMAYLEALERAEVVEAALIEEMEEKEMKEMKGKTQTEQLIERVARMRDEWEKYASIHAGEPMPQWDDELFQEIISSLVVLDDYEKEEEKEESVKS